MRKLARKYLTLWLASLVASMPAYAESVTDAPATSVVLASSGSSLLRPEAARWCGTQLNLVLESDQTISEGDDAGVIDSLLDNLEQSITDGCPQAKKASVRIRSSQPTEWNFTAVLLANGRWSEKSGSWMRQQNPVRLAAVLDQQSVEAERMYQEMESRWRAGKTTANGTRQDPLVSYLIVDGSIDELAQGLDTVLLYDSRNWMFNRYDRGSVYRPRVVSRSRDGSSMQIYGDFRYNQGLPGWVRLRMSNGQVSCIELHDFVGNCRNVGSPGSWGVATGIIVVTAATAMVSGGHGGSSPSGDYEVIRQPGYQQPGYAPAPYVQPIGGAGGLYGCASPPCM